MWRRLLPCAAIALAACSASGGSQASEAQADVFTAIGADANAAEPDTSGSPEPDPFAEVLTADVRVVVNYAGAVTGPLQVGAFTTNPPTGAPAAVARVNEPVFPVEVTLKSLEEGTWYVVAMVDALPESPSLPGVEDPLGVSAAVTVLGDGVVDTTVTIQDPAE